MAVENADLLERLRQEEESLEGLLRKTFTAQEDERKRLARELHDETSQILSALIMSIDVLESETSLPERFGSRLEAAKALAEEAAGNLDKVLLDLRPALLDELGLVAALRWYLTQFGDMWQIRVELTTHGARRLPAHLEMAAFRISQEALSNVAKHAQASTVRVRVVVDHACLLIEVEDNGVGFDTGDASTRARKGQAAGLVGMRERAELLGGTLEVGPGSNGGTIVAARIPLSEPEETEADLVASRGAKR
jgi:signal transduction histidine kinase